MARKSLNGCTFGVKTRTLVEQHMSAFADWRTNDFLHFKIGIEKQLDLLFNKLSGRPSWAVCTIIAVLSSVSVGLLVVVLNHAK